MRRRGLFSLTMLGALAVLGTKAAAQDAQLRSPFDDALDALRDRVPTPLDNKTIDDWITAELRKLKDAPPNEIKSVAATVAQRFADQYNHPENSIAFKERFAERTAALFLPEYQRGRELQPQVARAMARVLLRIASERTRETLIAGLAMPDQVVRYLSAKTLAAIQEPISTDGRITALTIDAIADWGSKEVNDVVAAKLYEAMSYPEARSEDAVRGILKMLDGRLELLRGGTTELGRGELPALRYLDSVTLNAGQRAEVVRRLAPLLRIHAQRYNQPHVVGDEKAAIAETIYETENLLNKLVSPSGKAPSVTEKMLKGGNTVALDMEIELKLWIGTEQKPGILNEAPWNVPIGAP